MPAALLEFSRSVLREKFSAVVRKSVYTFEYDRFQKTNNYALYRKLLKARDAKGIIIATDTSVKAFELKFIEVLHQLDRLQTAGMVAKGIVGFCWSLWASHALSLSLVMGVPMNMVPLVRVEGLPFVALQPLCETRYRRLLHYHSLSPDQLATATTRASGYLSSHSLTSSGTRRARPKYSRSRPLPCTSKPTLRYAPSRSSAAAPS